MATAARLSRPAMLAALTGPFNMARMDGQGVTRGRACLARALDGYPRPAERVTISLAGNGPEPHRLCGHRERSPLTHEARGVAVLKRVAERIVSALLLSGVDLMPAHASALQMARQLGDAEFATLGPTAVPRGGRSHGGSAAQHNAPRSGGRRLSAGAAALAMG